jgi:hypothetical protein
VLTGCGLLDKSYVTRSEHDQHAQQQSGRAALLHEQVEHLQLQLSSLEHSLQVVLGRLYCIDDRVQTFLSACHRPEGGADPGGVALSCPANIREATLTFLGSQPHVVVYLDTDRRRDAIIPLRLAQLRDLVQKNRLLSTRYIVISHPLDSSAAGVSEAEKRGSEVVEYLRELGRSDADNPTQLKIHGPWVFRFRLSGSDIGRILQRGKQLDRPIGREPQDLRKGIWVFRTDCHIPE